MSSAVPAEYARFVQAARDDDQIAPAPERLAAGKVTDGVAIDPKQATELIRVAAKRAAGLYRPTKRTEVVWVEGDSELALGMAGVRVRTDDGLITVHLPVRCDQSGETEVQVVFAVGAPDRPAGVYASTFRTPIGPPVIVDAWGDALVAYAWQCVLGLVSGIAGAIGKDSRGNVLVPAELSATRRGLQIVPMARHRFSGSSGLLTKTTKR